MALPPVLAMKRGNNALENGSLGGDNMLGAVQRLAGISLALGMPLQYEDQTAALQLGRFATKPIRDYLAFGYPRKRARPPLLVRCGGRGRTVGSRRKR
jgi:hypothetical protein